jgi:hypothetical protein
VKPSGHSQSHAVHESRAGARPNAPLARVLAVLGLGLAALLTPAAALASAPKAKAVRVEVPTPAAGDVTIESITTTIPSHAGKAPELQLSAPNDRALPASVIALSATRTKRTKHSATFHTVVLVFNRRAATTAAHIASEDEALAEYGRRLVDGDEPRPGLPGWYVGASFVFTMPVPATTDTWSQQQTHKLGAFIEVGAQPNADAGATDIRACRALSATIELGSNGKPTPGATYAYFGAPDVMAFKHNGVGQAFVNFARDCHAGAGGLTTALTPVKHDLGFGLGQIGPPPGPKPIGPEQAALISFGAELIGDSELAEEAEEDFVLWLFEELFGAPPPSSFVAPPVPRAHAAAVRPASVPANGQVTKVEVRGRYAGHCPKPLADSVCEGNVHIQDLRPSPGGGFEVIETSQPFTIEASEKIYTIEPINFKVQKGDYIGLATGGGRFDVLTSAPGVETDVFTGHEQDNNGAQLGPAKTKALAGEELNMRVTLQPSE